MHRLVAGGLGAAAIIISPSGDAGQSGEPASKAYQVVEGAVDRGTHNGYRRYHATCSHCHGPDLPMGVGG